MIVLVKERQRSHSQDARGLCPHIDSGVTSPDMQRLFFYVFSLNMLTGHNVFILINNVVHHRHILVYMILFGHIPPGKRHPDSKIMSMSKANIV